ncbi:Beta/Gamma Crystallin Domain-Containing Protein 2 [Manis pentadactyla]|nr:Beta/Gamma Crystallin Domain-Containing Protein 2 [Manis pentadactyla]
MHMIRLRREFGFNSDLSARRTLALRKELGSWSDVWGVQDVGTGLCIMERFRIWVRYDGDVWLTLMLKLKCRILTPGLGLELVRH